MASPQKENGYTPIAHELIEAFYKCKMSEYERVVVLAIWRKTYGWNKVTDWVSNGALAQDTGISRRHVIGALTALKKKQVVVKKGKQIYVNKNYAEWDVEWRVVPVRALPLVPVRALVLVPSQAPTKERLKETLKGEVKTSRSKKLKKPMSWNKPYNENNHSDDLPIVDADTGQAAAPPVRAKSASPLVFKVFLEVLGVYPPNWRLNRTQRLAAENLHAGRGLPAIRNALNFYKEHKDQEFCPIITSPYDLDSKWEKLKNFKKKNAL